MSCAELVKGAAVIGGGSIGAEGPLRKKKTPSRQGNCRRTFYKTASVLTECGGVAAKRILKDLASLSSMAVDDEQSP